MSHPSIQELETLKNTCTNSALKVLIEDELQSAKQTFYKDLGTAARKELQEYRQELTRELQTKVNDFKMVTNNNLPVLKPFTDEKSQNVENWLHMF